MEGKSRIKRRRIFSEEFKRARVEEYERGEFSVVELSRLYKISDRVLYRWIHKYSVYSSNGVVIVELEESSHKKLKEYEERIKALEQAVGRKQLMIEFLEQKIALAEDHYQIDIKKNSTTPPSKSSSQKST